MKIRLIPVRMDQGLEARLEGEVLWLNGQAVDLSGVVEGEPVAADRFGCDWLAGDVVREKGEISVSLILPHGAEAPDEARFPAPFRVARRGRIALPLCNVPDPRPTGVQETGEA